MRVFTVNPSLSTKQGGSCPEQPNSCDPVAYLAELGDGMLLTLGPEQALPAPPLLLASGNRSSQLDSPTISYVALNSSFSSLSLW